MLLRTLTCSSDLEDATLGCTAQGRLVEQCLAFSESTALPASSVAQFAADVFIPETYGPMPTSEFDAYPL